MIHSFTIALGGDHRLENSYNQSQSIWNFTHKVFYLSTLMHPHKHKKEKENPK